MSEEQPGSYVRRNITLALIAAVFVVAAIFRLVQTAQPVMSGDGASADVVPPNAASSDAATPDPAAAATRDVHLQVRVALSPDVSLPPGTTVFVIVRASDGNPMPLAVKRLTVADLPKEVTLSDADAMVPGRSITAAGRIEIVARASLNGDAKRAAGDYDGQSGQLNVAAIAAPIALLIDHRL